MASEHDLLFLHEISQKISEKKPLPKLLKEILESSKLVMNGEASSLLLYEPKDKKLHFQVATGTRGKLVKKYSVAMGKGIAGWVAKHKKPLLIEDCYKDPRFSQEYDRRTQFNTKSMICVPMLRKNRLIGVMQVINKKNGGIFEQRDLTIFETLASQCAIAIENARLVEIQIESEAIERELETAREIQQNLLPSKLPDYDDIQIAAQLIPAKQVGGDYYNFIKINENQSLFMIADVSGKSISAALIVSIIDSSLHTFLKLFPDNFCLMTLVKSMDQVLIESTTVTKYATCWFGLYDHNAKTLTSVNAGHNPPYLFRAGQNEPQELTKGGFFLGFMENPHENEIISLQPDDVLVFYTDGVTEALNRKEEEYGESRLIKVIRKNTHKSANNILTEIRTDVSQHVGKALQSDDFTCAVLKINY